MFPNGNGDLAHDRRSAGEYAVVARKSDVAAPGAAEAEHLRDACP
jgi:hypothetical protein